MREWQALVYILGTIAALFAVRVRSLPGVVDLGILLISLYTLLWAIRHEFDLARAKHVPVAVLVGKGSDVGETMWSEVLQAMRSWGFDADEYRRRFQLERDKMFLHHEKVLPATQDAWLEMARDFRQRLERLAGALREGRRIFHVFLNAPATLCMGLGAGLGTAHEVVVHHLLPGTWGGPYHAVFDVSSLRRANPRGMHILQEPVTGEFKYVCGEGDPGKAANLYLSIFLGSHDPRPDVNRLLQERLRSGESAGVFHIVKKADRLLDFDDDWILCEREIRTLIAAQISKCETRRVHLFLNLPVALGFLLGMGIKHFSAITIYNWEPTEGYSAVLPLEKLSRTGAI
jgi:hypothetical protein